MSFKDIETDTRFGNTVGAGVRRFHPEDFFSRPNKAAISRLDQLWGSFLPGSGMIHVSDSPRRTPLWSLSGLCFQCPDIPRPHLQLASTSGEEMCLFRKLLLCNYCHYRSWHFDVTAHIHEYAGQISASSFLLHQLRSFQPQEMIFPEYLPPVLLEASAQFIQPPKTLTSVVLTVGRKGLQMLLSPSFYTLLCLQLSCSKF